MGACASVDVNEAEKEEAKITQTRTGPPYSEVLAHEEVAVTAIPSSGPYARLCSGSRGCEIPDSSERAITLRQLQHVFTCAFERCKEEKWTSTDPRRAGETPTVMTVTLRDIVENFVKPATAGGDRSLVEMISSGPQRPMWYVSHWWGEPMHDMLSSLEQHAADHGTSDDTTYWVSAFAMRQSPAENEAERACDSVRKTSRFQAMQYSEGLVTVLDRDGLALTRARVLFEMYVALVELPPNYKMDVYTTTALDPDQPLHRPGHASPAVWLRPKGGGAQHVGWQPLRWAVGLVDGLLTDVSQMGPLIATQAKARRERAFPMTVHTVARRISWRQSSATDKEDLAWLRKMLAGKEDAVDATLRARMGVSQLPPLLVSRELSAEPILSQYLQALRRSQLRRLAVACVHRPSAERCLQLAMALPPCLEEISLFKINGGALVPVLCKLFMRPGPAAAGGASGAAGSATAGKSAPAAPARPPSSFPPVPGATVAMPRLVEVAGPGGGAGPPVTSGTHQTGERLERLERLKQPSRNWDSLSNNGMPYNGLTRVTMRSCALTDTEGIAIASALEHNDTLKVLVLRDAEFGDKTAGALAAMLAQNSTLQTLKLPRSLIGDEGAASFGSALERNGALTTLSLNSTFVGEAGAIALARGLAVNAVLRTLNLRQNGRIGDKGVVALGAALAQNGRSALRELDLNGCGVGDDGARSLGDALAARRADGLGLTSLVLIKNCIGERGAHELASALRAHAAGADSLVKLQVHSQRPDLPESAKAALKEAWAHGKRTDNAAAKLELENPVVTPSVIKIVGRPPRHKFTPKFNHA